MLSLTSGLDLAFSPDPPISFFPLPPAAAFFSAMCRFRQLIIVVYPFELSGEYIELLNLLGG